MAEENLADPFPDLREVENKVGRKTPDSLLAWMRDAVDGGDGWRCDVQDRGGHGSACADGSFSDRIRCLKQEMMCLRSADVRILRQLVAVHEGIEAMRWLMDERGAPVSRGSSLTGSQSSLATVEEQVTSGSPYRESPSPTFPQDLTESTGEESSIYNSDSTGLSPSSPPISTSKSKVASPHSAAGRLQESAGADEDSSGGGTIRRALLRSIKSRKQARADTTRESRGKLREAAQPQESGTDSQNNGEEEESSSNTETVLLGYDAQWCWVESQDDVTFL